MKPLEVELRKIKMFFDVRVRAMDPRYADNLAVLQNNGVVLPPVKIYKLPENGSYGLLDGRHRLEAAKLRGKKTIRAIVVPYQPVDIVRRITSFKENMGGALPPTKEDYEMMARRAIRAGWKDDELIKEIPGILGYLRSARHMMSQQKSRDAIRAVRTSRLTIVEAASRYKVHKTTIVRALSETTKLGRPSIEQVLGKVYKAFTYQLSVQKSKVMKALSEGVMDEEDGRRIITFCRKASANVERSLADFIVRVKDKEGWGKSDKAARSERRAA